MEYLKKIIDLCAEKDIPLVLMTAPYQSKSVPTVRYMQNYLGEIAEKQGIPYIDFFELYHEANMNSMKDMADNGHLNIFGAEKVTAYLGKWLNENYDLQDHREEEKYNFWWDDLIAYKHDRNTVALEIVSKGIENFGFSSYCSLLNEKGYIVAVSALVENDDNICRLNELAECLGSRGNYNKAPLYYGAIFEDGEKLWEYAGAKAEGQVRMASNLEIAIGNQKYGKGALSIAIGGEVVSDQKEGINVVVFDKYTHSVISSIKR